MAKISTLPAAGPITGAEGVPVNQDGHTRYAPLAALLNSAAASALAAALLDDIPFISAPAAPSLQSARIISIDPGIDLPDDLFVRYAFRDAPGGNERFNFIIARKTGEGTSTDLIGVGAAASSIDPTGLSGFHWITLVAVSGAAFPGVANGQPVGFLRYDFGDGSLFAGGPFAFEESALQLDKLQQSVADAAAVQHRIDQSVKLARKRDRGVFQSSVVDPQLLDMFVELKVENADWASAASYIVSFVETAHYPGLFYRIIIRLRDVRLGIDVAMFSQIWATDPRLSDELPEWIPFHQGSLPGFTGIAALARMDWSTLSWSAPPRAFATAAEAGIAEANIVTNSAMDRFLDRPEPREVIFFGDGLDPEIPNADGVTGWPTLAAACQSTWAPGVVPTLSTYPFTNRCAFSRQIMFACAVNGHREDVSGVILPPFSTVQGRGQGNTVFTADADAGTGLPRTFEANQSACIQDCTLIQKGQNAYIGHTDENNGLSRPATVGPEIQRWRVRTVLRRCELIAEDGQSAWAWGTGISSGQYFLIDSSVFRRRGATDSDAFIGVHNSPGSTLPATLHLRNCLDDSYFNSTVGVISGYATPGVRNRVIVEGGHVRMVGAGSSIATLLPGGAHNPDMPVRALDRIAWDIQGTPDAACYSDVFMKVLKVAPGTVATGALAERLGLTGPEYDVRHGRGWKLVMQESSYRKLGAILGDLSGAPETLQLDGGPVLTMDQNYSAMSEAAILAAMNAVLGAGAVSVVRLDRHLYPDIRGRRWTKAGATAIPAHRLYVYGTPTVGSPNLGLTIVPADGQRPDGFTLEAFAAGGEDYGVEARTFAAECLPELSGYDGPFGVVAGVATPGAIPAIGRVHKGVVSLF